MDGILIIDKPEGWTSHDVVARLRRILKTKKIGHTGTLDPFATGVLVMLVGKATRLAQFLDKDEKEYEALVRFGFETETGDRTGNPRSQVSSPKSEVSPKSKVQSPKSEIQDPKSEVQDPKSKVQGPKSEVQDPKSEVQDPKSEVQDPKSEVQDPKSEVQDPKSEVQDPKSEVQDPKSEVQDPKSKVQDPKSKVQDPKSKVQGPKSEVQDPKSEIRDRSLPSVEDIEAVLPQFRDEIEQVPPMYSAKKIAGKKLYELARKGVEVERKAVAVRISKLEIFEAGIFEPRRRGDAEKTETREPNPGSRPANHDPELPTWDLGLRVACSAGTYIRTLAEDIGRAAGSAAHLAELRRTRAGRFDLSRAVTLEELEKIENLADLLVPMNEPVSHLPEVKLTEAELGKVRNGMRIPASPALPDGQTVRLTAGGELVAIGSYQEGVIRPRLVF